MGSSQGLNANTPSQHANTPSDETSLKLNRGLLSQMFLITSHISHVLLNSSSVVCGKLIDLEDAAEVPLAIEEELMLGEGEPGRGVGATSWNTKGSYTGTLTERCI